MGVSVFTRRKRESPLPRPLSQGKRGAGRVRLSRTNLWLRVRFELCGIELERRVVPEVEDAAGEICSQSPVGKALLTASVGERITVEAPGGDVVVKVLEIINEC